MPSLKQISNSFIISKTSNFNRRREYQLYSIKFLSSKEALESVMCDIIKIILKRRLETRSGKGNQPLNNKTDVECQILKLEIQNVSLSFYFI